MKKYLPLLLAPALASCGLLGLPRTDVTGNISNAPTDKGTIRMAVVGVTFSGITNTTSNQLTVVPGTNGAFAVALPSNPSNGGYQVIAYADTNGNQTFDPASEPRTKDNGKVLVYNSGSIPGVPSGWSQYEGLNNTKTGTPFNNYDLSF